MRRHQQPRHHHQQAQHAGRDDLHPMRFLEQHDGQRTDNKHDHCVGQAREQPHLEGNFLARRRTFLTHAQLRHGNHQIHQQRNRAGAGQEEFKHRRRRP